MPTEGIIEHKTEKYIHYIDQKTGDLFTSVPFVENGRAESFHPNGERDMIVDYTNGIRNGEFIVFNEQGRRITDSQYLQGRLNGPSHDYNERPEAPRDAVTREEIWVAGELEHVKTFHGNGSLSTDMPYIDGQRQGVELSYDDKGSPMHEVPYDKGEPHGEAITHKIGGGRYVVDFQKGERQGNVEEYDVHNKHVKSYITIEHTGPKNIFGATDYMTTITLSDTGKPLVVERPWKKDDPRIVMEYDEQDRLLSSVSQLGRTDFDYENGNKQQIDYRQPGIPSPIMVTPLDGTEEARAMAGWVHVDGDNFPTRSEADNIAIEALSKKAEAVFKSNTLEILQQPARLALAIQGTLNRN